MTLVLSLFPGIGLLDMAFESEGFCVVRGPDPIWGGDVRTWHPPPGRFDGVIGGPPCKKFSRFKHLVKANRERRRREGRTGFEEAEDLIPEFERVVGESLPRWFLMENVPGAPLPKVPGYHTSDELVADSWVGGETRRMRRFTFGVRAEAQEYAVTFAVEQLALHRPDPLPAVCASGARWIPAKIGGSGKVKRSLHQGRVWGYKTVKYLNEAIAAHGLPPTFLERSPLTVAGKIMLVGNGVPLALGRAVAQAVRRALNGKPA